MLSDGRIRTLTQLSGTGPDWSPDGTWVAFTHRGGLYIVRRDGRGARRLTRPVDGPDAGVSWSPDGRRIAFVRDAGLYVMRADGTHVARIVRTGVEATKLAWEGR